MKQLYFSGKAINIEDSIIGTCSFGNNNGDILFYQRQENLKLSKYSAVVCHQKDYPKLTCIEDDNSFFVFNDDLIEIQEGDILHISSSGELRILYTLSSNDNVLFITQNCNHNCIMCSQPPRKQKDLDFFYNVNSRLLELIPDDCETLGITGGEPTLLGQRLFKLYNEISDKLPNTNVHTLTNGRAFYSDKFCNDLAHCKNKNLTFGIPLYSDYSALHNYIVQSRNAFEQTIKGLYNLAYLNQKIELRIVISQLNYSRLIELANFIYINLPFVNHVVFMGLEDIGNAVINSELVWIESQRYIDELNSAVEYLYNFGIRTSIYNIPLCLLPPNLWKHSTKSISDWKTKYLDSCNGCSLKENCCGVFGTSQKIFDKITPFLI
jgi:His-Xaa-Ser system radical SAM maturase HxsC